MGFDKVGQILMQIITVGDRCMLLKTFPTRKYSMFR